MLVRPSTWYPWNSREIDVNFYEIYMINETPNFHECLDVKGTGLYNQNVDLYRIGLDLFMLACAGFDDCAKCWVKFCPNLPNPQMTPKRIQNCVAWAYNWKFGHVTKLRKTLVMMHTSVMCATKTFGQFLGLGIISLRIVIINKLQQTEFSC